MFTDAEGKWLEKEIRKELAKTPFLNTRGGAKQVPESLLALRNDEYEATVKHLRLNICNKNELEIIENILVRNYRSIYGEISNVTVNYDNSRPTAEIIARKENLNYMIQRVREEKEYVSGITGCNGGGGTSRKKQHRRKQKG